LSIRSLRSAVAFLTVVPVADEAGRPGERLGRAYFPAVGALLGLVAGAMLVLVGELTTAWVGAIAGVVVLAVLTGGLHLDGLADAADGLLSPKAGARRLEIMRDSRIGSFGAVALILVLAGDVAALSGLAPERAIVALVVAGAMSRWAMLGLVALLPYLRADGLGVAAAGAHRRFDLLLGSATVALVALLDWRHSVVAVLVVIVTATLVAWLARRRIGGATGDVYGAATELCQLAALVAFASHA
jgi:adenosylcobinamide-GDP ribazoletransferase